MTNTKPTTGANAMLQTIKDIASDAAESTVLRFTLLVLAIAAAPFYLLSLACAALGGN